MLPLSYTISSDLQELLNAIDILRQTILTVPIAPGDEQKFRWEATIARISGSLSLSNVKLSKREVETALAQGVQRKPSVVTGYSKAIRSILDAWTASTKVPTPTLLDTFKDMVYVGPFASYKRLYTQSNKDIRQLLIYLENQTEHPVVHAGIALGILSGVILPAEDPGLISRLVALVFLAKAGYDLRGLSPIENTWALEASSYHVALSSIKIEGNMNHWLLFFSQSLETNYRKVLDTIGKPTTHATSKFWSLNERQQSILHLLDDPDTAITNKILQKRFNISQITASRDLSKLALMGIIVAHGRGRSVSYTRL